MLPTFPEHPKGLDPESNVNPRNGPTILDIDFSSHNTRHTVSQAKGGSAAITILEVRDVC